MSCDNWLRNIKAWGVEGKMGHSPIDSEELIMSCGMDWGELKSSLNESFGLLMPPFKCTTFYRLVHAYWWSQSSSLDGMSDVVEVEDILTQSLETLRVIIRCILKFLYTQVLRRITWYISLWCIAILYTSSCHFLLHQCHSLHHHYCQIRYEIASHHLSNIYSLGASVTQMRW